MNRIATLLFAAVLTLVSAVSLAAPVNINSADAKTIETSLVGVGSKTASAIVSYREKNGPFKSADDLEKVKGIGPKLIEKNRTNILVK
jgi:competence protein ComEA